MNDEHIDGTNKMRFFEIDIRDHPPKFFASHQNFDPFKRGLGLTIFGDGKML